MKELEKTGKNSADIRSLLAPLRQLAAKIVGDECGAQIIEDCALCLLLHFLDKNVTSKNLHSLGFGTIDPSIAKEIPKVSWNCYMVLMTNLLWNNGMSWNSIFV